MRFRQLHGVLLGLDTQLLAHVLSSHAAHLSIDLRVNDGNHWEWLDPLGLDAEMFAFRWFEQVHEGRVVVRRIAGHTRYHSCTLVHLDRQQRQQMDHFVLADWGLWKLRKTTDMSQAADPDSMRYSRAGETPDRGSTECSWAQHTVVIKGNCVRHLVPPPHVPKVGLAPTMWSNPEREKNT